MLEDEGLAEDIHLHLQSIGKYVKAMDIVHYLDTPAMKECLNRKKTISLATAQRWMLKMGYQWSRDLKGQYVDGHKCEDVVKYRQEVFIPAWKKVERRMCTWTNKNLVEDTGTLPQSHERHTVVWFHDESTFYANDWHKARWVHSSETAVPYPKGEGTSEMVADMISADYGWLRLPDGSESVQVLFKAGKAREGYFTNEDILYQATNAMDILEKHYPNEDHVLVFDNATTHMKWADNALSARRMAKFTPKEGNNWLLSVTKIDANGKPTYGPDGKVLKEPVQMENATFADGSPQSLYFGPDHPQAGVFKGMAVILQERGLTEESKLRAECPKFKCKPAETKCCCRRVLYSQPDFIAVKSLLETHCEARGFSVIFLPKFHCELNFIEQCWGYAKRIYRHFPPSSKEADLEANLLEALKSVPLTSMQRFVVSFQLLKTL